MQCAARSSGRVRLNEPRNDFASGVRELATTTASRMRILLPICLTLPPRRGYSRALSYWIGSRRDTLSLRGLGPMPKSSRLVFTFCVLIGINTMNFFDRQVVSAVQEKIRKEWQLSDTDLGRLGTAFILLYAVVGVPLGRLADRWNRRWLLAAGVALWSAMTFISGFAWGFWSLFVFRLAVGIGEASCAPTTSSLIGDLVPAERRARAMSIFMLGLPIGLALSFFVSGWVAQHHGWRAAFFVAGVPGLLLAVAAFFILDPVRGGADGQAKASVERLPFAVVARRVLRMPTMWLIVLSGRCTTSTCTRLARSSPRTSLVTTA